MRKSLVDCAARGKVSESRRADMARRAHFSDAPLFLRIRIMQRRACGLCRVRSTRRSGRDRPPAWRARLMSLDTTAKPPAPAPSTACPRNSGAGRSRRSLPRWRWPRWIRRSPTLRCPPSPPTSMSARPTWSGWSTSIRSRWLRRCCRSARSAKSSAISGSISAACCCSRWPRSAAPSHGRCPA